MSSPNSPSFFTRAKATLGSKGPRVLLSHSRSQPNVLGDGTDRGSTTPRDNTPTTPRDNAPTPDTSPSTPTAKPDTTTNTTTDTTQQQTSSTSSSGPSLNLPQVHRTSISAKTSANQAAKALKSRSFIKSNSSSGLPITSTSDNTKQTTPPPEQTPIPAATSTPTPTPEVTTSTTPEEQQPTPITAKDEPITPIAADETNTTTPPLMRPASIQLSAISAEKLESSPTTPRSLANTSSTRMSMLLNETSASRTNYLDEEKEKLKEQKEEFREEVVSILRALKIEQLTAGVSVRIFTKSKTAGVQGVCKLSKDRKYVEFYEGASLTAQLSDTPTERIIINGLSAVEPSLSASLDPQLTSLLSKIKDTEANLFSLIYKDPNTPAIVLSLASRSDFASWMDGLACLMGATLNSSVQLKSDIELMCEVLALDKLYPAPELPPLPPPELLVGFE